MEKLYNLRTSSIWKFLIFTCGLSLHFQAVESRRRLRRIDLSIYGCWRPSRLSIVINVVGVDRSRLQVWKQIRVSCSKANRFATLNIYLSIQPRHTAIIVRHTGLLFSFSLWLWLRSEMQLMMVMWREREKSFFYFYWRAPNTFTFNLFLSIDEVYAMLHWSHNDNLFLPTMWRLVCASSSLYNRPWI